MLAAAGVAACDQGKHHDQPYMGPPIHVVDWTREVKAGAPVRIYFDRLLHPSSQKRQAFTIIDVNQTITLQPVVSYDPVARAVTLSPQPGVAWTEDVQFYKIHVYAPTSDADDPDEIGLRAFDRAPYQGPSDFEFRVSATATDLAPEAPVDFCLDVLPLFQERCSVSTCHGGGDAPTAAAGLSLQSPQAVQATMLGARRVAQGANTGPIGGSGAPPGRKFGVDMPIVDPDDPGNSWVMYKLLLAQPGPGLSPERSVSCGMRARTPTAPPREDMSADERVRLSSYVLGNPMPYPPQPGVDDRSENLTLTELERIRTWITRGAPVADCSFCTAGASP